LGTKVSPPSKGGETYLYINQIIMMVFDVKIFLKFTAMGFTPKPLKRGLLSF